MRQNDETADRWLQLVSDMPPMGMTRMLAIHLVYHHRCYDCLYMLLSDEQWHLVSFLRRMEEYVSEQWGKPISLHVRNSYEMETWSVEDIKAIDAINNGDGYRH